MNLSDAEMVMLGIGGMVGLGGPLLPFLFGLGDGARTREQSLIYLLAVAVVILSIIFVGCALYDAIAN